MDIGVWEVGLLEVSQKSQANRVFTESERKTKGQYVEESRVSIIQRRMTEQEERKRESQRANHREREKNMTFGRPDKSFEIWVILWSNC